MDLAEYRVTRDGEDIRLAPTEFRLLRYFMENPGRVYSREQLLDAVWGREIYLEPRTVDVHVRRLRKSLNAGGKQDIIRTVRAAGYSLDQQV
jgi:two-component system phosphate regulon response regulator PhoB